MSYRTIKELWDVCFVANNEDEAWRQAHRQIEPFLGTVIEVAEVFATLPNGDRDVIDLGVPVRFRVLSLYDDVDWENGEMIPEWNLVPIDADQVVTVRGVALRIGDLVDSVWFAPGLGTEAGFASARPMIQPEPAR